MSSSAHSALASLTANYTDSEPEEDDVEKTEEESADKDESDSNKPAGGSISPPGESNSRDAQSVSSAGDSTSGGSLPKANNPLGLVSYQDDLIDDDVVDDFDRNSDSLQENENEVQEDASGVQTLTEDEDSGNKQEIVDLEDVSQDKEVSEGSDLPLQPSKKIRLPPEPPLKCSAELQEKFTRLYERKMKQRFNMNAIIQSNKQFRNPSIYEKLIIRCNIDELGTNYPKHIYDPHIWDESSYYDELAKAQKTEMDRREKEKKDRTKVEFVSGTVKKPTPSSGTSGTQSDGGEQSRRKSKWDQKGVMPVFTTAVPAPTVQPVLVQPPFTANASGTKGTVINAFGSLPKKPKI